MKYLILATGLSLLITGCASSSVLEETQMKTRALENRADELEIEIIEMQFEAYIELLDPYGLSDKWCKFRISGWDVTQATLKSFIDRKENITGNVDTAMIARIQENISDFNSVCRSNLVWNP